MAVLTSMACLMNKSNLRNICFTTVLHAFSFGRWYLKIYLSLTFRMRGSIFLLRRMTQEIIHIFQNCGMQVVFQKSNQCKSNVGNMMAPRKTNRWLEHLPKSSFMNNYQLWSWYNSFNFFRGTHVNYVHTPHEYVLWEIIIRSLLLPTISISKWPWFHKNEHLWGTSNCHLSHLFVLK